MLSNKRRGALQPDALTKAGCEEIYQDVISGCSTERPGLARLLTVIRKGDVLVVWKLDRLGRSLPHLVETVGQLEAKGVGFRSLTETIDTTTPGGRLIFHVFAALGQFERDLSANAPEPASKRPKRGGAKADASRF